MVPFVLADLVDWHDVRVIEVRRGLCLQAESLQVVGGREPARSHHLEGQHAVEADLPRLEDDPHSPLGDQLDELVVAEVSDPAIDAGRRGGDSRLRLGPDQVPQCAGREGQDRGRVAGSPMIAQGGSELLQVLPIGEERRQLGRQVRVPGHQARPVRLTSRFEVLEVSGDDLMEPLLAIVARLARELVGVRRDGRHAVRLMTEDRVPIKLRRVAIVGLSSRGAAARRRPPWWCSARRRSPTGTSLQVVQLDRAALCVGKAGHGVGDA